MAKIKRENWVSRFRLVGKAMVNDYTFKIDEQSKRSSWVYNSMNLGVDSGGKYGVNYADMMGGYSPERENTIYARAKDNPKNAINVAWEDRFDDSIIDSVHNMNIIKVGIERKVDGKLHIKNFLSAYDAIKYISEKLTSGTPVSVTGQIKYSMYNGNVQMNKSITGIYLTTAEESDYSATFNQSVLINSDSASMSDFDESTGFLPINAFVLDYAKEINGHEVKGDFPYPMTFEHAFENKDDAKKYCNSLLKVKRGYTQINFDGEFVSGGATVMPTIDSLNETTKKYLASGLITMDAVLTACAKSNSHEHHTLLTTVMFDMVGDEDGGLAPELHIYPERYDDEDMDFSDIMEDDKPEEAEVDDDANVETVDDNDIMDLLGL